MLGGGTEARKKWGLVVCEIDIFDEFSNRLLSMKFVRARKPHTCHGCSGAIEKGKLYRRYAFTMDGEFRHEKMCRPCALDSDRFAKAHGFAYFYPYGWIEFVHECIVDDGADADPRWKMIKVRADQRRKKRWEAERQSQAQARAG